LQPFFHVLHNYVDSEEIGKHLGPVIGILFLVNDRGIRGNLLQRATMYTETLDKSTINQAVFEPMCSGFSDSSTALRELTLKATLVLVPHLTQPNLEKLSRYLIRLQSDPETSIRTHTIIYFGHLASHLTPISREKLLLPAFVRAMKDTYMPCRLQALRTAVQVKQFFDPIQMSSKVLPAITPHLLDPASDVRRAAFQVVDELLFVLRQESERMGTTTDPVDDSGAPQAVPVPTVQASATPASASSTPAPASTGWLSSWVSSSTKPSEVPTSQPQIAPTVQPTPAMTKPIVPPTENIRAMHLSASGNSAWDNDGLDEVDDAQIGDDGWGDDDDGLGDSFSGHGSNRNIRQGTGAAGAKPSVRGGSLLAPANEDDFFGGFDHKPAKPIVSRPAATRGKLVIPKKAGTVVAQKPVIKKLAVDDESENGWDDF
jgi:SCY1-like protein 1